uniref:Uncharacterized protein n=1 Tax=viral metagenome TaxID=1070528 RepID=A0A6C0AXA1_9ZZZZ|tara:strand:+ start:912 stop:1664 length:753 start_codon:yes stop_codon:yes gene_type:complete
MSSEDLDEIKSSNKKSFMNHVFRFDQETKFDLLNLGQYSFLAIIPVIGLNKLMKHYIPEADETKGSIEILFEIIGQLLILFIGLFYIHRLITFVPTYSGEEFEPVTLLNIVLIGLTILLSIQTKLGEKSNILIERFVNVLEGHTNIKENNAKNTKLRVTQPIVQQPNGSVAMNGPPSSTTYIDNNSLQSCGIPPGTSMPNPPMIQQPSVDFNGMYQQNPTPMIGAQSPMDMGVMAANEALGGNGSFGSMF